MTRRGFLASVAGSAADAQLRRRRPNIVMILADDLGYGELGCQGNPQIPTPHIDSIARHGVRFTNGYVSSPYCSPSRAGLMTGRYQTRFGHELNVVGRRNLQPGIGLPLSETTLAEHLKKAGYSTGVFGKWHLGGRPEFHPMKRGFDEFFGFLHEGHFYVPPPYRGVTSRLRAKEPPYDDENFILRGSEPVEEKEYLTDAFTREALSFMDRNRERPFFLYLPYNAVHSPMQAPVELMRRFNGIGNEHRQVFAAMLKSLDDGVGAVLRKLRENRLEEDTLIFFLSDNGGPVVELTSSNAPLRGGKGQLWEGGIRIPFLFQWKGKIPGGRAFDQPVISLDIFSTAVAAAGGNSGRDDDAVDRDGIDLTPLMTGSSNRPPHDALFWRYGKNIALRKGDWKLVRQVERGQREADYQLFNLISDAGETTNLRRQQPEIARELLRDLERLNGQMSPPLWSA
ncbi:MAG: sulfatase [Bryobacteraceae bacterium]